METTNVELTEEQQAEQAAKADALHEKIKQSQRLFDRGNHVCGMTVHMLTALINGHMSTGVTLTDLDYDQYYEQAQRYAIKTIENNESYMQTIQEEVDKLNNEGVQ